MTDTRKVEFLKAYDNGTWGTEVIEVPIDPMTPNYRWVVTEWAETELSQQTQYRNVVLWAVYNEEPEDEET